MAGNNGADDGVARRIGEIDAVAEAFSPVAKTLAGDLRDSVLEVVRRMPESWAKLSEADQTAYAHTIADTCKALVRRALALLESEERTTIAVLLETVAFKPKGIEAKLGIHAFDPAIRHALVDAQGKEILIVVADAARYLGERAPARIDKQQSELPLGPSPVDEKKVEGELDTIIASDQSEPAAGRIADLSAEREAARKDPFAAGKAAALHGFNETRNPFPHPSLESAEWLRGHAEGERERQAAAAATSGKRRRRRRANGPDEASV